MSAVAEVAPYLVVVWLVVVSLLAIGTSRDLVHVVVCLSVLQSATWVLMLSVGARRGATAPIFDEVPPGTPVVDPVMQALSVTNIVVGGAVITILLALAVQIHKRSGTLDPAGAQTPGA